MYYFYSNLDEDRVTGMTKQGVSPDHKGMLKLKLASSLKPILFLQIQGLYSYTRGFLGWHYARTISTQLFVTIRLRIVTTVSWL